MDESKYEIHFEGPIEGFSLGENNNSNFNYRNGKEQSNQTISNPIWNVPYRRNPFFTGREDLLKQLHLSLSTTRTAALTQPQALSGLGGIGKTQTALEYVYRYCEEYRYIIWMNAANRDSLISDFITTAELLHLPSKDEQDQNQLIAAVKRWLEAHEGWLLILDNADDLLMASDFLPASTKGHILLTTRTKVAGPVADVIPVEKMDTQEGMLLLLRRSKIIAKEEFLDQASKEEHDEALSIINELDGLPLALDQAGAYIEETRCTLSDYFKWYKQRETSFLKRRGMNIDHPEPIATTWSLSFERIKQENPLAIDILYVCAFLAPDSIPEDIFIKGASVLGPNFKIVIDEPHIINEAIRSLLTYSLIRRDPDHTLTIHRLVQAVLRQDIGQKSQYLWTKRTIRAVRLAFPTVEYNHWQHCQQYLPHVDTCVAHLEHKKTKFLEASDLLLLAAEYLISSVQYAQAESFHLRALSIRENVLGSEHPHTANTLHSLAHLYEKQGKYEQAESFHLRELAIREKVFGLEDINIARSLHCLAKLYQEQGKYAQAESFHLRALSIRENVLGSEHPHTAVTLHSLAHLYEEQGKYEQAESFHLRELAIREKVFGMEHSATAESLRCLAKLYQEQGKYAQAESFYLRALSIRENVLGSEHPIAASILYGLANLYEEQHKYEEAESFYLHALSIHENALGSEHPDTASILQGLANLYQEQGKYAQAESFYLRALSIHENVLGLEHPDTAFILNKLAHFYQKEGKYEQAESFYLRALSIRENVLGSEHPANAGIINGLANLYQEQGKYEQAESFYLRALSIAEKALGSKHPDTAINLHSLANLYQEQGKYEQAESFYLRALSIHENVLGLEHPTVANTLYQLAKLYEEQGKYEQAEAFYLRDLAISEKILGSEHLDTAITLYSLAHLYQQQGKHLEAESFYQRSLSIYEKIQGKEHPNSQRIRRNLKNLRKKLK